MLTKIQIYQLVHRHHDITIYLLEHIKHSSFAYP